MSAKSTTATDVEIFGAVYHVRGQKDPEYMQELARLVDDKMSEISESVQTVDTGKIAILTALNLADELYQCRKQQDGERDEIQEKVTALTEELAEALKA